MRLRKRSQSSRRVHRRCGRIAAARMFADVYGCGAGVPCCGGWATDRPFVLALGVVAPPAASPLVTGGVGAATSAGARGAGSS